MAQDSLSELAPPVEFKRMLSWQLSTPSAVPVKIKKKRKKKSREETQPISSSDSEEDTNFEYTVVVVNSDGEEEVYYSAPESPAFSDNESPTRTRAHNPLKATPTKPRERQKSKSKKQKKKVRYMTRMAVTEFLGPLCDLVCVGDGSVDVGGVDVTSRAQVPRLTELCLRKMRKNDAETPEQLPYLLQVLLHSDHSRHSMVSIILRWLERQLALPFHMAQVLAQPGYNNSVPKEYWKLPIRLAFPLENSQTRPPDTHCNLHVPLFMFDQCDTDDSLRNWIRYWMVGPFLHFVNFLSPLFGREDQSSVVTDSLTSAQLSTISYVNGFVQSRYKNLSEVLSGVALLWPGYVYWARGQVKQAVAAFQYAVSKLECPGDPVTLGNHRAAVLNEIGRMLSQFSERELACRFFRESEQLVSPQSKIQGVAWFPADSKLIHSSAMALEAAVYDCGLLTSSVARNAARLWKSVLGELNSLPDSMTSYWPLYLAACESKMLIHSGKMTGINPSDPSAQDALRVIGEGSSKGYLEECRELLLGLVTKEPMLHYHLSMVHAMLGHGESSRKSWSRFVEIFIHMELPTWVSEGNTKFHMFNTLTPAQWYPWQPLVDLLNSCSMKQAPVLPVRWRTRLLHPHYPYYYIDRTLSRLADHCSQAVGIRLTQDGYITADWHMDTPPMRTVLLNPYTGELCFPRDSSKAHYYTQPPSVRLDSPAMSQRDTDFSSLPWPVRVLECDQCVVELSMASTRTNLTTYNPQFANYSAYLSYYGDDGSCKKLDLRRVIRKQLKEVILSELKGSPLEDKVPLLDKLFESGRYVGLSELKKKQKLPPRFTSWTWQDTKQTYKILNISFESFVLHLMSVVVLGEATLMLEFCLDPSSSRDKLCNALVFVNCLDGERFSDVKVHCVASPKYHRFEIITPSPQLHTTHFRHIRYVTAIKMTDRTQTFMVFDLAGEVIVEKTLTPSLRSVSLIRLKDYFCPFFSLGSRLFGWKKDSRTNQCVVYSCNVHFQHILLSPAFPVSATLTKLVPIPGLLFVHTNDGVQLLNPRTLTPVVIQGLNTPYSQVDTEFIYQFSVPDCLFDVLKVWDISSVVPQPDSSKNESDHPLIRQNDKGEIPLWEKYFGEDTESEGDKKGENALLNDMEFGRCHVGLCVDNRLVVLDVRDECVMCVLDVTLPGKPTELHPMGASGYIVSVTNFLDHFREEMYWITVGGQLKGVLPCLGVGPHSFVSVTLPGQNETPAGDVIIKEDGESKHEQGLYLYFNDGQGAIVCVLLGH